MVFGENTSAETSAWESLNEDLRKETEQTRRELKEISMMLEQSELEVNKLAQRNGTATSKLPRCAATA